MAFNKNRLAQAGNNGNSNAPRLWTYKTDDVHADVDTSGYMNAAADKLKVGDVITVVVVTNIGASNEAVATYGTHIVMTNALGVVNLSTVTVNVVTNSD